MRKTASTALLPLLLLMTACDLLGGETPNPNQLSVTHLEIATDLNSSRVVISRLLKKMEKQGKLVLGRNTITLKM